MYIIIVYIKEISLLNIIYRFFSKFYYDFENLNTLGVLFFCGLLSATYNKNIFLSFIYIAEIIIEASRGAWDQPCDCKCERSRVRFPLEEMEIFNIFISAFW